MCVDDGVVPQLFSVLCQGLHVWKSKQKAEHDIKDFN